MSLFDYIRRKRRVDNFEIVSSNDFFFFFLIHFDLL